MCRRRGKIWEDYGVPQYGTGKREGGRDVGSSGVGDREESERLKVEGKKKGSVDCEVVVGRKKSKTVEIGNGLDWTDGRLGLLARKFAREEEGRKTGWANKFGIGGEMEALTFFSLVVSGGNGNVRREEGSLSLAAAGAPVTRAWSPGTPWSCPIPRRIIRLHWGVDPPGPAPGHGPLDALCTAVSCARRLLGAACRCLLPNSEFHLTTSPHLIIFQKKGTQSLSQSSKQSRCRGCPTVRRHAMYEQVPNFLSHRPLVAAS